MQKKPGKYKTYICIVDRIEGTYYTVQSAAFLY
jgi:hypothetical protein